MRSWTAFVLGMIVVVAACEAAEEGDGTGQSSGSSATSAAETATGTDASTGSVSTDSAGPIDLIGRWTCGGTGMEFKDDGTYATSLDGVAGVDDPDIVGEWTLEGMTLSMTDTGGKDNFPCDASITGTYEVTGDAEMLDYTVIDDACMPRRTDFGECQPWNRVS